MTELVVRPTRPEELAGQLGLHGAGRMDLGMFVEEGS